MNGHRRFIARGKSAFLIVALSVGVFLFCRNPFDFSPDEDDLESPPDPPQLLRPVTDTVYYYEGNDPYPHDIVLEWRSLAGAQFYEIEASTDSLFADVARVKVDSLCYVYEVEFNDIYYWRVRAYSPRWTWYTAFSETWHFKTVYSPND